LTIDLRAGGFSDRVAFTPDGKHAYVANNGDGTVSVITTATGAVSAPITVGKGAAGVAICPARSAHKRR
jgi:YVTN family beta-propeller protein